MAENYEARLKKAEELERNARLELAWSQKKTEWPHHRADYARAYRENWKAAETIRREIGAPEARLYI